MNTTCPIKLNPALPWWKQVIGGAFCPHYVYGLIAGFFLGQAFLLAVLIAAAIGKVMKP